MARILKPQLSPSHFRDKGIDWWTREDWTPHDKFIFPNLEKRLSGRILDVGAGRGALTFRLRDKGWRVAALEINKDFIDYCMKKDCANIDFVGGNAELLPFKDGVFDAVVCTEVLMHLQNPDRALREMSRVVRPRGHVLVSFLRKFTKTHAKRTLTALTGIYERKYGKGSLDYRYDSMRDIRRYIEGSGLEVKDISDPNPVNPCILLQKEKVRATKPRRA